MTNIQQQAPGTAAPAPADVAGYAAPDGASPIHWFRDITRTDIARVGGKGANLGEMTRAGLPVPRGFVIDVDAYARFRLDAGIGPALDRELATLNVDDSAALQAASVRLRAIVEGAATPPALAERIEVAYHELCGAAEQDCLVAVRSSATAEDTAEFSFAGMFESFLNVSGGEELVKRVRSCWASTFHARVLYYRIRNGMAAEMPVAVIVQRMIQSEKAGVLFTVDPATRNPDLMVVEAAWGLGEVVVLGQVTPDHYVLDKKSLEIRSRAVNRKEFMLARTDAGATTRIELASDPRADAAVLGDAELRALGELGRETEAHYGAAQDIEFAEAGGTIYLTQTRPITTLGTGQGAQTPNASAASASAPLLQGLGASPGIASGQVRVLSSPSSSAELRDGEVLVAPMTSPDWVPLMRRAVAVVTDSGGMTSHAAIVSRELGIPCVVGTREGTRRLTTGQVVTVDGKAGTITSGAVKAPEPAATPAPAVVGRAAPITATKLYVNLGEPDRAAEAAAMDVDGVGLLRAEFMLLSALEGAHPRQIMQEGHADDLVHRFVTHLRVFAHAFAPRPVVYRAMDFRTNEFRGLRGGDRIEPHEDNPMIGYRGCYRYVREPDLFALELRALAEVRRELPNLQL
ncbi:MAG TPA: phosphoenolpyruvate synthase, partial [Gemmatimonadaceae bacterium]|nr:phosphoenolpyruvate synthase [Gemmatimonadaceae bacterium]